MRIFAACALGLVTLTAGSQPGNQPPPPHIHTALNHFTVIDPGEPIVMFALADHSNFEVQPREGKLFLLPLSANVTTNLFIWTASRELTYEVDAAGDVSKMDMLLVAAPQVVHSYRQDGVAAPLVDDEIEQLSSQAWAEALLKTETVADDQRTHPGSVAVKIEGLFRSKDQIIIRYSIQNLTSSPFRVTAPDIFDSHPSQTPVSLLSLRNHQLSEETFSQFKALKGQKIPTLHSEVSIPELAAGGTAIGIVSIRCAQSDLPRLYQFSFGTAGGQDIAIAMVM